MATFRAIGSERYDRYEGPPGYKGSRPFDSYKTYYGNQKITGSGIPVGTTAPDLVQNDKPLSLQGLTNIATRKTQAQPQKNTQNVNSLGMNGFTPVANFDLINGGTAYDSTYTGIPQTNGNPVSTQSTSGQSSGPQLMLSPSGQYQQVVVPLPKPKAAVKPKPKPKAKPAPKKKNAKYADSEYLSEIRALERELTDYRAKMNLNKSRAGTQHSLSERDLRQQGERDRSDLKDDFAARGIVLSGVYGSKLGEYNTLFGQQDSELDRQYKDALTDISNQYKDYLREVGVQKEQARLAAIRRRSQKLGKL